MTDMERPDVIADFASSGRTMGNEVYFPVEAALQVVESCSQRGLAVLGVEGFERRDSTVRPRLDRTIDFSDWTPVDDEDRRNGNQQIIDILKEWESERSLVFVFFIEEQDVDEAADT